MAYHVTRHETIEISELEAARIFEEYLQQLKNGMWIRAGELMAEGYTSHSFVYSIQAGDPEYKDFELVAAVQQLQDVLKLRKLQALEKRLAAEAR